jgi:23S rRNA (uracil1939-C5)-methyltransferase
MSDNFGAEGGLMELVIDRIAAGGDGVARKDGLVIFVPRTAPGDRVEAFVEQEKRLARGRVRRVLEPSPLRAEPACEHYTADNCGGCQLQHMSIDAQRDAKRGIIRDSLQRIGRRTIALPDIRSGTSPWRYRHRLSLALRRRREGGAWYAGFHEQGNPGKVFELRDCLIADQRVLDLWKEVMSASSELPDAFELRGTVRLVGDRGAFTLEGGSEWPRAEAFADLLQRFAGVWWIPRGARRRRVSRAAPSAPGASFSQVNPGVAEAMHAHVLSTVLAFRPTQVLDAYSGAGDLASALHARGVRVTAIELDEEATTFAASRLAAPSRAVSARVEDVIADLLPTDVVVLNPPRAGVDARVTRALESSAATRRVVYVSCDPATLARDVARLPSWQIESVTAFDMFPQTAHVETVLTLARSAA